MLPADSRPPEKTMPNGGLCSTFLDEKLAKDCSMEKCSMEDCCSRH